jgi:hypothetical protein
MNIVPVGVIGKIISLGDRYGWFVKVEDVHKIPGDFLLWNGVKAQEQGSIAGLRTGMELTNFSKRQGGKLSGL